MRQAFNNIIISRETHMDWILSKSKIVLRINASAHKRKRLAVNKPFSSGEAHYYVLSCWAQKIEQKLNFRWFCIYRKALECRIVLSL